MAIVTTDDKHYTAIADMIRRMASDDYKDSKFTPEQMPLMIRFAVEDAVAAAEKTAIEHGKSLAYDEFWDEFQVNGTRTSYMVAFGGYGWNANTFRPKYNIYPVTAERMFYLSNMNIDLEAHLNSIGVKLDFSRAPNLASVFLGSQFTRLGVIDTRKASSINGTFNSMTQLVTIDELILKDDGTQAFSGTPFQNASNLENIKITGIIGKSGLDFKWSYKLSRESIESIIDALSDTASGQSITFNVGAVANAFDCELTEYYELIASEAWLERIEDKPNWTITLV